MALEDVREKDRFARHVGIELVEAADGCAKAEMTVVDHHLNGVGLVNGAAIFSLADYAFAAAANSSDIDAVTVTMNVTFLHAAQQGRLTAEAREIALSRRLGTYQINVWDEAGTQIAALQGTAYRKPTR